MPQYNSGARGGGYSGGGTYKPRKDVEIHLVRAPQKKRRQAETLAHSGTWKIAYADFATAMMAFFLLLWLMMALKPEQKDGLATYFDPMTATYAVTSGSGDVLAGRILMEDGSQTMARAPITNADKLNQTRDVEASPGNVAKNAPVKDKEDERIMEWLETRWTQLKQPELSEGDKRKISAQVEESEFKKVAKDLHEALKTLPNAMTMARNLVIDQTAEGFRIQLVDQDKTTMFESGSITLNPQARHLLAMVAQAIQSLPHRIAITGHTDGNPYRSGNGYTNWDLSIGRANASRRALVDSGLDPARIASVVGKADTEHLLPDEPLSPSNRRISFVLLKMKYTSAPPPQAP